jgi:hypothetical protein
VKHGHLYLLSADFANWKLNEYPKTIALVACGFDIRKIYSEHNLSEWLEPSVTILE